MSESVPQVPAESPKEAGKTMGPPNGGIAEPPKKATSMAQDLESKVRMSNVPKREHKLLRGLSDFVSSVLEVPVASKEDLLEKISKDPNHFCGVFGQTLNCNGFKRIAEALTGEQWQKLVRLSNIKISEAEKIRGREKVALDRLLTMIANDEVLKHYNVSVTELAEFEKHYYCAKVHLICGSGFIEGNIQNIVAQIKRILRENKVELRIFCMACSSKNLRFGGWFCLCYDCGTLSEPSENRIVKKYKPEDKQFWWAQAMADSGSGAIKQTEWICPDCGHKNCGEHD